MSFGIYKVIIVLESSNVQYTMCTKVRFLSQFEFFFSSGTSRLKQPQENHPAAVLLSTDDRTSTLGVFPVSPDEEIVQGASVLPK